MQTAGQPEPRNILLEIAEEACKATTRDVPQKSIFQGKVSTPHPNTLASPLLALRNCVYHQGRRWFYTIILSYAVCTNGRVFKLLKSGYGSLGYRTAVSVLEGSGNIYHTYETNLTSSPCYSHYELAIANNS
jgi:hypothetical protein